MPSSVTGTIGEIRVKEGDKLRVGQVIFTVENGAGAQATPPLKKKKADSEAPRPLQHVLRKRQQRVNAKLASRHQPATAASSPQRRPPKQPRRLRASEFKLPELGENIDSGDLVRLLISPGRDRL